MFCGRGHTKPPATMFPNEPGLLKAGCLVSRGGGGGHVLRCFTSDLRCLLLKTQYAAVGAGSLLGVLTWEVRSLKPADWFLEGSTMSEQGRQSEPRGRAGRPAPAGCRGLLLQVAFLGCRVHLHPPPQQTTTKILIHMMPRVTDPGRGDSSPLRASLYLRDQAYRHSSKRLRQKWRQGADRGRGP